jgi:hypothetical protein
LLNSEEVLSEGGEGRGEERERRGERREERGERRGGRERGGKRRLEGIHIRKFFVFCVSLSHFSFHCSAS